MLTQKSAPAINQKGMRCCIFMPIGTMNDQKRRGPHGDVIFTVRLGSQGPPPGDVGLRTRSKS
jgi:hypothetical protein